MQADRSTGRFIQTLENLMQLIKSTPTRGEDGENIYTDEVVMISNDPDMLRAKGSMPFCVELDNLKDTDAPIHQPAAMLVAAD